MKPAIALIGPGRVGCAVTKALYQAGYRLTAVVGRDLKSARSGCAFIGCAGELATTTVAEAEHARLILLAVPDDAIRSVAIRLQTILDPSAGRTLLHFSGVHPADIMRHQESNAALVSLHPLLPFADPHDAFTRLPQAAYATEGDASADRVVGDLAAALGGRLWKISKDHKHLYHAAACIASNYLVTLIAEAGRLLAQCGISAEQGPAVLEPLLTATLENVRRHGVAQGLTGPIVRGDTDTLRLHVAALRQSPADLSEMYCTLGYRTMLLARESGRLDEKKMIETAAILGKSHPAAGETRQK